MDSGFRRNEGGWDEGRLPDAEEAWPDGRYDEDGDGQPAAQDG